MKQLIIGLLVLVSAVVMPATLSAHEGHDHRLMGTLVSIDAKQLVMKTTEGAETTIVITPATTFHRGKVKAAPTDLKPGLRVVVNVGAGKLPLTAKDVQYAAAATTK